jgi:glycosyltransferase involved in cell wall biosynthesis
MNVVQNELPTITVLIANYNYGEYVETAINSAVAQDYPGPLQICIVNDGSTDDSWEIIKKRIGGEEAQDKNLTVIKSNGDHPNQSFIAINVDNGGASFARNTGIEYTLDSTHAYAILDADDEYYPNKVSKMVKKFVEDPFRIGVVYADYDIHDLDSGKMVAEFKQPFNREVLGRECIVHSNALISKLALVAVNEPTGFYDVNLHGPAGGEFIGCCEDYDLWMRISERFIVIHIPESLAVANITGMNQTTNVTPEIFNQNWNYMMAKAQNRANA